MGVSEIEYLIPGPTRGYALYLKGGPEVRTSRSYYAALMEGWLGVRDQSV